MLLVIFDYVRAKIKIKNMGHQEQASKWAFGFLSQALYC